MRKSPTSPAYPFALRTWLKIVLPVIYGFIAVLTAYLAFTRVRGLVAAWELTSLEGITVKDATPIPGGFTAASMDPALPLQSNDGPEPLPWDGASRVTLLIMGLDYRDWQDGNGPPLTDTMLLLTIDPLTHTAGLLSIPRDLWVNIPGGFGYDRINTAYKKGEASQLPGGGAGLAMKTVEGLLGVPVGYYAIIEFKAFERFIDEIGGVKLDIPEKIVVDPLGDNNTKTLKPGVQVLPGDLALAYVRARKNAGDDFGRAGRQQQVVLGIRDRILSFNLLPQLIARSGVLYTELSAGVHTNLDLDQAIRLAWLATQIPNENYRRGAIAPPDKVKFATVTSDEGPKEVLKPISEGIRLLRDEIFTENGPASPAAANMDLIELMQAEAARISVLNGANSPGLAARTAEYLKSQGANVTGVDNAQQPATNTRVTFYTGKPYTVRYLVDLMQINPIFIHYRADPDSPVDVAIVLGNDWANNNPMNQP